jgi:hypothetical protein
MLGADFLTFWEIGRAVLEGRSPYSVDVSRYPPAAALLFAVFALIPYLPSFAAWCGISVVLYLHRLRRLRPGWQGLLWLGFTPFLFNLLTGQLDVIIWWAAMGLRPPRSASLVEAGDGKRICRLDRLVAEWLPSLAGAFLTLKPQLAAVLLPWFLVRWLRREPGLLLRWLLLVVILNGLPLLYAADIYGQWLARLSGVSEMKMGVSGGIFVLGGWGLPAWLLAGVGLALAVWGWFQDELTSRAAQLTAFPITIWYDDILLAGIGPALLLVPLSWLAFLAAALGQSSIPFLLIPLGTLGWLLWTRRLEMKRRTTKIIYHETPPREREARHETHEIDEKED